MLFSLSNQFIDSLHDHKREPAFTRCLENLALAYREGKHLVYAKPSLLRALEETVALSEAARGTFKAIRKGHMEIGALCRELPYQIVVEPRARAGVARRVVAGTTTFYVPYSWFEDSVRVQATALIGEDLDDAELLRQVTTGYLFRNRRRYGVLLRLRPRGGGGSSVADLLTQLAEEGICLCVVDSDKKSPEGSHGPTALAALQARRTLESRGVVDVRVLEAQELENLLPARLVTACLRNDDDASLRQKYLRAIDIGLFSAEESVRYLDVKKGLCGYDVWTTYDGSPRSLYQKQALGLAQPGHRTLPGGWCDGNAECQTRDSCQCVVFDGLGDKLLRRAVEELKDRTDQKIAEYFFYEAYQGAPIWEKLCLDLLSWACGPKPLRT